MKLLEYYEKTGDKNIYLYSINDVHLATYDGRNSIPERYNEMQVEKVEETKAGVNVTINLLML